MALGSTRTWGPSTSSSNNSGFSEVQNTNTEGFIPSTQDSVSNQSSFGTQNSQSNSESFSGISNPEALASLLNFIKTGVNGNPNYQAQLAKRQGVAGEVNSLMGNYSKEAAFRDAQMLMQQNLQKSMEAQMPSIMAAIQGAGTSASSMQGLLSQQLAQSSAQSAGALGAQQATSYGNIAANLSNTLEALTRIDNSGTTDYLKALELLRESTSKSTSSSSGLSTSSGSSVSQATGATPASSTTTTRRVSPGGGGGGGGGSVGSTGGVGGFSGSSFSDDGRSIVSSGPFTSISPAGYQYIPYDLQNPGFVNPYSNGSNQQAAADFAGYEW